ncbi:MAG: DUF5801 domain-containing protein, partial [Desulfovibrio sp.]|nr:DUF5801 domain-containing protein [Desulfovibrio sp.]
MSQVSDFIHPNSVNGQTVIVPKPEHGAEVTVQSSPGGRLDLGFDPAEATAARPENSNDLVFDLGANGKVVIGGFFEVGDETLPTLALPDGVEVAATDFFANSELDMSTAAGPGRASGSGTSYADDAGSLLDGLDKYGKLGTDYWGREREVDDEALGLVSPASGELIINVAPGAGGPAGGSLNGQAFSGIFEGWNPYANLGNSGDRPATPVGEHLNPLIDPAADLVPSRLSISFIPADHETVLEFRVTVPSGVALFTVNGAGDFVPLGSPGQTLYTFGPDAFNPGATPIYLTSIDFDPNDGTPIYNATDFDVSVEADIMDPTGPKATLETSFHVIVDAVAQIADGLAGETGLDQQANASGIAASTGERNTVTLHVEASFPDHDGSESHSLIFAGVPGGWDLPDQAGLDAAFGAGVATGISRGADGNVIITLDSTAASIGGDVVFDPHDWSNERDAGGLSRSDTGPAAIKIYAVSDETPEGKLGTGGADIDIIDNNHAEKLIGDFTVSVQEDKPTIIQNLVILSDETAGVQDGTNEIAAVPASVGAVLAAAVGAAADAPFVSVAQNTFTYNLYSDGADSAAENLPAGGSLAALNFELTDGAPSGWQISGGSKEAILLYNENGVVTGRVGGPDGALAFAVVVEGDLTGGAHNGNITFIQYLALEHPDGSSANETLAADLALTLRVTDSDGDQSDMAIRINVHDDAPIGGGHIPFAGYEGELMDGAPAEAMTYAHDTAATRIPFNFGADGPNADAALLISGLPVGTDFAVPGLMTTPEFGPDGAIIKPAADLSVKQEFSGDTLSVTLSTTADGTPVAVLTVTTAGHWTYTQYHALAHANPALVENSDAPLDLLGALGRALNAQGLTAGTGLTLTLTDRDGDTATYTLESNLHDAVPTLTVNGNSLAVLDDDQHDYTAPGVQGDFVPTRIEFNVDPGADGLQSLTFADPTAPDWTAPQISGAVDNNAFEWIRSADGKTLTLYQDPTGSRTAVVEFELGAVADGKAVVTVTQLAPFMHDSTVDLADISNIPLKLVDGDGDVARAGFDVRIYDDEQGLTIDPILRGIEERGDSVLDDSGDKLFAYADGVYDAQTWSGFEGRGDIFGADGMHPDKPIDAVNLDTNATGWGGVAGGPWTSPWTVGGAAVTVTQTVGADNLIILTGRAGGVDVFTLEVQQNGHYDYKELVNIDHHGADLPLQAAFRDADGDIVNTLDCTLRVREVPIVELEPIKSTDVVLEGHEATFTLAVHTDSGAPITSLDEFIDVVLRLPVPAAANGAVPIDIDAFNALSPAEQASGNYDFLIRHADATGTNGTPPENGGGIWKWEVDDPDNPRYYEVVVRIPAGDLADGHYQFSFETVHDNVRDPSETISLDLKGILSDGIGSASGGSAVDGHANALLGGGKHAETKITDPIGPEVGLGTHPTINELQGSDPECAYDLRFVTNSPE